jgi:serine/threonine protein kinase
MGEPIEHDATLDERYAAAWLHHGPTVSTADFLASYPNVSPPERLDVLLTDQLLRWRHGCPKPLGDYLAEHPSLAGDPESILKLVQGDFLARLECAESADPASYLRMFPELAEAIRCQCEVDQWLTIPLGPGHSLAATVDYRISDADHQVEGRGEDEDQDDETDSGGHEPTAPDRPLAPDAPLREGDFQLVRRLGAGGMGEVHEAIQRSLRKHVALKLIPREALDSPSRVRRFFTEARALARLRHPHIVGVHGIGRMADGRYFLVMDLVEGGTTLAALIKAGTVAFERAAGLVATVAEAIDHAHARGVIHRDLKPSNVLLDAEGTPHVTDFGLAKVLDAIDPDHPPTTADQVLGTPHYMSPEQADPARGPITPRADIYALGGLLYALLTGKPPIQGDSITAILTQLVSPEPVRSPRTLRADIPAALERICRTCLEKDPRRRYASAGTVATALRVWLACPVVDEVPGPVGESQSGAEASDAIISQPEASLPGRKESGSWRDWIPDRSWKGKDGRRPPNSQHWGVKAASGLRSRRRLLLAGASVATLLLALVLAVEYRNRPVLISYGPVAPAAPKPVERAERPEETQGGPALPARGLKVERAAIAVRSSKEIIDRFGQGTGSIAIVLDCSGSMIFNSDGRPTLHKFQDAKKALIQVLKQVPTGTTISIWTFSALPEGVNQIQPTDPIYKEPERTIHQLRAPSAWDPNQADDLARQLDQLRPYLGTPLVEAMWKAAETDLVAVKGMKTLLVLTDGEDNRFMQSRALNPTGQVTIAGFLETKFRPLGIRINMVYFSAAGDPKELNRARDTFTKPLERLDPPGSFVAAANLDELIASLRRAIKQRLTCQLLRLDGRPVPGDLLDVTDVRAESDVWWPTGLEPGPYVLRILADRAYQQEIQLNRGERVIVYLVEGPDGGIAFTRLLDAIPGSSSPPPP